MNSEERSQLIDALIEGDISEADFVRLEAEMLVDAEVRQEYYDRVQVDTLIDVETREQSAGVDSEKIVAFPRRTLWLRTTGIAALLAILATVASVNWFVSRHQNIIATNEVEPTASGYGVVAEHLDAKWASDSASIQRGEILPQGPLVLDAGIVQIDLFSGVALVVEGSANFEILSPMDVRVDSGKIRARVPEQARGFRIHTAAGEVVDLGTEFALDVTPDHADVHVIDGEIEWHPTDADMQHMSKGEALRASNDTATTSPLSHDPSRFIGHEELENTLIRGRSERRQEWLTHSAQLANDPRLLLYYPMSQKGGWNRQLVDLSPHAINGTIVRANRSADRWESENAALDFTAAGSRVRVEIPGEHRSMTLYCWARIDSLDRWYNSLFLTDGHELNEPHWQILKDGRLFFSVKKNDPQVSKGERDKHIYYSPKFWTPAQAGQWFQIATTYDIDARNVTHYINGEIVSREAIAEKWLVETVTIGAASIGNWSEPRYKSADPSFAVRNLNGAIDEFAIFGEALNAEEIRELYEIGKP